MAAVSERPLSEKAGQATVRLEPSSRIRASVTAYSVHGARPQRHHHTRRTFRQLVIGHAEPANVDVVSADLVVHLVTRQFPQGLLCCLGFQVPQRYINRRMRQRGDPRAPDPLQCRIAGYFEPQPIHVTGIFAHQKGGMTSFYTAWDELIAGQMGMRPVKP